MVTVWTVRHFSIIISNQTVHNNDATLQSCATKNVMCTLNPGDDKMLGDSARNLALRVKKEHLAEIKGLFLEQKH